LAHQYLVQLPAITGSSLAAGERNALCKATRLPGRQIQTIDRSIGLMNQKMATGYGVAEVTLAFHILNDYKTRDYFERWQNLAVDQDTQQIQYSDNYKFPVQIYQLKKGQSFQLFDGTFGASLGPLDIDFNIDIELNRSATGAYAVELEKAFPTTMNGIDLADASTDQTLEISIDLSYKNWKRLK
jgi:hypothetical protein